MISRCNKQNATRRDRLGHTIHSRQYDAHLERLNGLLETADVCPANMDVLGIHNVARNYALVLVELQ
jgi:hypothetical protein